MPFENEPSGMHISSLFSLESTGRRSIDSYERELAALRGELREVVARDEALLCEKDDAIRRQEFLTQECHHRLLNNLQMIAGLLVLQGRTETNVEAAARSGRSGRPGAIDRTSPPASAFHGRHADC